MNHHTSSATTSASTQRRKAAASLQSDYKGLPFPSQTPAISRVMRLAIHFFTVVTGLSLCVAGCDSSNSSGGTPNGSTQCPGQADAATWLSEASCTLKAATGTTPLIDNLDDKDGIIPQNEGRSGIWFTYNDGLGNQTPAPNTDSCYAFTAPTGKACTSGSDFPIWAGIGVNFNASATSVCAYDVSAYQGVRFTLSGTIANGTIRFEAVTLPTQVVEYGGTCTSGCSDSYGKALQIDSAPVLATRVLRRRMIEEFTKSKTLRSYWDSEYECDGRVRVVASWSRRASGWC